MRQQRAEESLEPVLHRIFKRLKNWSVIWGYTTLPRTLNIEFMSSEDSDMGRCHFASNTLYLNASLLDPEKELILLETLCHEAAHWMAFRRYGLGIAPHGPEWEGYMRKAGFEPRECMSFK
ncbi:SprT-like domain-containing protein [bacterium]|nr:SprT-like domain-containing protein [bacterium]